MPPMAAPTRWQVESLSVVKAVQGTRTRPADVLPAFSNRGTRKRYADLVAPGTHILGLRVPNGGVDQANPTSRAGTGLNRPRVQHPDSTNAGAHQSLRTRRGGSLSRASRRPVVLRTGCPVGPSRWASGCVLVQPSGLPSWGVCQPESAVGSPCRTEDFPEEQR